MKKVIKKIKEWWAARKYARQLKKAIKEARRIKKNDTHEVFGSGYQR